MLALFIQGAFQGFRMLQVVGAEASPGMAAASHADKCQHVDTGASDCHLAALICVIGANALVNIKVAGLS